MNNYTKEEQEYFLNVQSIVNNVEDKSVYLSKFLNVVEQRILKEIVGKKYNLIFDGGYDDATLKRALISKFPIEKVNLNVIVIELETNNKFYTLRHPTVKWHFYNMGINENLIGDIILYDDKFVICLAKEIFDVAMEQTRSINKCPVSYKMIDNVVVNDSKEVYNAYCSSLRIDNVCAKTFHLSRGKAQSYIENERLTVNGILVSKFSYEVKEEDVLNIKAVGKVIIKEIAVNNRSGKYIVIHNRFLRRHK